MAIKLRRIIAATILLACIAAGLAWVAWVVLVAWGIGCLVSLALCYLLEQKLSRLEQRPFHMRAGQLELISILWPLYLVDSVLRFYSLWLIGREHVGRPSTRRRRRSPAKSVA